MMKKIFVICMMSLLISTQSLAELRLLLSPESEDMCDTIRMYIKIEGWESVPFESDDLFGVQLFLSFNHYETAINLENSYVYDTSRGGGFDPDFSGMHLINRGTLKIVAGDFYGLPINDRSLLAKVEIEALTYGTNVFTATLDHPSGGAVYSLNGSSVQLRDADDDQVSITAHTGDSNGNGCVDYCECEGDFNDDGSVAADDVCLFIEDYGRNIYNRPCTALDPCNGDFNCDGAVAANDVDVILADFGRSQHNTPCPEGCFIDPWCTY